MSSTALGAEKAIIFISDAHESERGNLIIRNVTAMIPSRITLFKTSVKQETSDCIRLLADFWQPYIFLSSLLYGKSILLPSTAKMRYPEYS